MAPGFIPGLQLAREFYAAVVRPLLEEHFPQLRYAAALIGGGSEVAAFDSPRSADHNWGPRLQVFLPDDDASDATAVTEMLASRLPASFRGFPVAFPVTGTPKAPYGIAWRSPAWVPGRPGISGSTLGSSRWWTGWPPRRSGWRNSPAVRSSTTGLAS